MSGGGGMMKYLQIYLALEDQQRAEQELDLRRQAAQLQGQQLRQTALTILPELAANMRDPSAVSEVADSLDIGLEPADIVSLVRQMTPSVETQREDMALQGRASMDPARRQTLHEETAFGVGTGGGAGQAIQSSISAKLFENAGIFDDATFGKSLSKAFATRSFAGMSPGGFAEDQTVAGMSEAELTRRARIAAGMEMTAEQSATLGQRGHEFQEQMKLAAQQLNLEEFYKKNLVAQGAADLFTRSKAAGINPAELEMDRVKGINTATEARTQLLTNMLKARGKASEIMRQQFIVGINANNAALRALGLPAPQDLPLDADVNRPGLIESLAAPFGIKLQ